MTIKELIATNLIIFVFALFFISCNKSNDTVENCDELQRKYDSLLAVNRHTNSNVFYIFGNILDREEKLQNDSILINEYKSLLGKNKNLDLYIWDRIKIINKKSNTNNGSEKFLGNYRLKPNQNHTKTVINRLKLTKDSIYLFKNSNLIISRKSDFLYTSDEYTIGKLIIDRYFVKLNSAFGQMIFINDNLCMDCGELQFHKIR